MNENGKNGGLGASVLLGVLIGGELAACSQLESAPKGSGPDLEAAAKTFTAMAPTERPTSTQDVASTARAQVFGTLTAVAPTRTLTPEPTSTPAYIRARADYPGAPDEINIFSADGGGNVPFTADKGTEFEVVGRIRDWLCGRFPELNDLVDGDTNLDELGLIARDNVTLPEGVTFEDIVEIVQCAVTTGH